MSGPGVVIGFDGSAPSVRALEWAAAEATLRKVSLTVCHALEPGAGKYPAVAGFADPTLARGVALACDQNFRLHVVPRLVAGPAAPALLEVSGDAEVLVVGTRGTGRWSWPGLGSVSEQLASSESCPLLLVPDDGIWRDGPVVVGVDGTPSSERATGFAFDEAHLRNVGVLAVCWSPDPAQAEQVSTPWRRKYPDVAFSVSQALRYPPAELRALAGTVPLVVVGAHSAGDIPGLRLGTVARGLLENVAHPIAVVR